MLPGWTESELLHEVVVSTRRSFPPLPDTLVIERPGWLQLITPSLRQGGLNEVVHSDLADDEADAVIDATLADYGRRGLRYRWSVGPGSAPADLAERLSRRGLERFEVCGMARQSADPLPPSADDLSGEGAAVGGLDADLSVAEVDENSIREYTAAMAAGWGMDPGPLEPLHRAVLNDPARRGRLLLARWGGVPAATASLFLFPRSAFFIGAVVLPPFRGRGLYRALCAARLRLAADLGVPLCTTHAMAHTSAPILRRLGFVEVCRFSKFMSPTQSAL